MTPEDEAFDEIARKQGHWGGGYQAKRQMAADKFIAAEERKVGERYGYVPKLHPSEWMNAQPVQEPSITRPCRSCNGTGDRDTGIPESPIATCKPCNGTGQIALAQPAQEPVAQGSKEHLKIMMEHSAWDDRLELYDALANIDEFYATAPPKREWVGLTDVDIEDCMEMSIQKTCRAIEAKLKEKNT
jgi:hypothetical protein